MSGHFYPRYDPLIKVIETYPGNKISWFSMRDRMVLKSARAICNLFHKSLKEVEVHQTDRDLQNDCIKILQHLGVNRTTNQSPLLLTINSYKTEDLVQMCFEQLNVPALYLIQSSVASLYATGMDL
jgi:Actin